MNGQVQAVAAPHELATLLIPMYEKQLVLPNVSVAEVIPYAPPQPADNAPDWYLGTVQWRNIDVPVVSFEALNGEVAVSHSRKRRIAVLNGLVDNQRLPFCAMVTEAMPRLMRIMADEIAADDEGGMLGPCELGRVLVNGERAVIPNIDYLQQQFLNIL